MVALVDWWAVARDRLAAEFVAKPAVMALLIAAAWSVEGGDDTVATLIIIGLACSLVGDVALMIPDGPFELGLGSFLVAHCFTIAALLTAVIAVAAGRSSAPEAPAR